MGDIKAKYHTSILANNSTRDIKELAAKKSHTAEQLSLKLLKDYNIKEVFPITADSLLNKRVCKEDNINSKAIFKVLTP